MEKTKNISNVNKLARYIAIGAVAAGVAASTPKEADAHVFINFGGYGSVIDRVGSGLLGFGFGASPCYSGFGVNYLGRGFDVGLNVANTPYGGYNTYNSFGYGGYNSYAYPYTFNSYLQQQSYPYANAYPYTFNSYLQQQSYQNSYYNAPQYYNYAQSGYNNYAPQQYYAPQVAYNNAPAAYAQQQHSTVAYNNGHMQMPANTVMLNHPVVLGFYRPNPIINGMPLSSYAQNQPKQNERISPPKMLYQHLASRQGMLGNTSYADFAGNAEAALKIKPRTNNQNSTNTTVVTRTDKLYVILPAGYNKKEVDLAYNKAAEQMQQQENQLAAQQSTIHNQTSVNNTKNNPTFLIKPVNIRKESSTTQKATSPNLLTSTAKFAYSALSKWYDNKVNASSRPNTTAPAANAQQKQIDQKSVNVQNTAANLNQIKTTAPLNTHTVTNTENNSSTLAQAPKVLGQTQTDQSSHGIMDLSIFTVVIAGIGFATKKLYNKGKELEEQ